MPKFFKMKKEVVEVQTLYDRLMVAMVKVSGDNSLEGRLLFRVLADPEISGDQLVDAIEMVETMEVR